LWGCGVVVLYLGFLGLFQSWISLLFAVMLSMYGDVYVSCFDVPFLVIFIDVLSVFSAIEFWVLYLSALAVCEEMLYAYAYSCSGVF